MFNVKKPLWTYPGELCNLWLQTLQKKSDCRQTHKLYNDLGVLVRHSIII